MSKSDRRSSHKKQERSQIKSGVPSIGDLKEGVTVFRFNNKLVQYVKHKGILYTSEWNRVGAPTPESTPAPAVSGTTHSHVYSDILETSSQFDPQEIPEDAEDQGYMTFGNGVIMQWGTEASSALEMIEVTFPIPFPNNLFTAVCSTNRETDGNQGVNHCKFNDTSAPITTMQIVVDAADGHWLAIGN